MVKVKICGITNLEDALLAESLGADVLGFIFTKKSPRYIDPKKVKKIISSLGPFVFKAGVFMDQKKEEVKETASYLGLDLLQFHGKESFAYCSFFRKQFKVVKVFFPKDSTKFILQYRKLDALMFDIPYAQKKENKILPEKSLKLIKGKIKNGQRVIVSGGINSINLKNIIKINPYGLDFCRGTEKLVGKKDKNLMEELIREVKNAHS